MQINYWTSHMRERCKWNFVLLIDLAMIDMLAEVEVTKNEWPKMIDEAWIHPHEDWCETIVISGHEKHQVWWKTSKSLMHRNWWCVKFKWMIKTE